MAALTNSYIWLTIYVIPLLHSIYWKFLRGINLKKKALLTLAALLIIGGLSALWGIYKMAKWRETQEMGLTIIEKLAKFEPSSSIFIVNGTRGDDDGILRLIDLMGEHGLPFYKSHEHGRNKGPNGLIDKDDVVIIKVNTNGMREGEQIPILLRRLYKRYLSTLTVSPAR
jgi:hypothetical protein